ncbi:T9SS type A sorting domain-containing protein [Aquirufa sp. ROCK-SH2]
MMNKLIKFLLIQGFVLSAFFVEANDKTVIPAPQPLINGLTSVEVFAPEGQSQLLTVSGCAVGTQPIWSYIQVFKNGTSVGPLPVAALNTDPNDISGNSYYTQPLGNTQVYYEYTLKCEDPGNPGTALGPNSAKIKFTMFNPNEYPKYPLVKNTVKSCGNGSLNEGAVVALSSGGCSNIGSATYWVHPNSDFNSNTIVGLPYYVSKAEDGIVDIYDNSIQTGNFTAKCRYQYYDYDNHVSKDTLTRGLSTYVTRHKAAPAPSLETYAYFKDANLKSKVSVEICPDQPVELTHRVFDNNAFNEYVNDYNITWQVDNLRNSGGRSNFNYQQTIQVSEAGSWFVVLINKSAEAQACNVNYGTDYRTRRSISNVANQKPTISGDSQICPGGENTISITNAGSFINAAGTTFKWFVNDQFVDGANLIDLKIKDNATKVQASYRTTSLDELGRVCDAPKSDALVITQYQRPATPTIAQSGGSSIYCEDVFPVSDVVIEANNPIGAQLKSYTWQLGNTAISGNNTNTISSNVFQGSYTAIVTDLNGCNSFASNKVLIDQYPRPAKPLVTNTNGKDAYCDYNIPFNAISLQTTSTSLVGKGKFLWNTGASTSKIDVTTEGKYSVTITDDRGCISQPGTYEIVKYTRPATPTITNTNGKAAYCDYTIPFAEVTLQSSNTSLVGNPKYSWNTGSALATTTVNKEGIYSVTVTDANDCASIPATYEIVKYTRPAKPVVTRKSGSDAYCDYKFPVSDLTLESSNTALVGNAIYTWNNSSNTKVIPVTSEGKYSVVVTDGNGCESVSSDAYTITKWISPVAPKIALTGKNINCAIDENEKAVSVAFSVSSATDGYSFEWFNTGSSTVLSKTNALAAVSANGTYYSIQTDKNGCYSPKSDGIKVTFVQNPSFSSAKISKMGAYGLKAEGLTEWANATAGDYQWKAGTTINTATIDNIKVTAANNGNGDYSVKRKYAFTVENSPIVCFSNLVKYTFVADPDFTGVAVYPNPTSGTVKIDLLDEWKNATVVVYDLVGRPVYNGTMDALAATGNSLSIDLSSLGSGLYILQIKSSTGDKSYQGKILVNK